MSKISLTLVILFVLLKSGSVSGQHLPIAVNFKPSYRQQTRDTTGIPGKKYWQNGGKYAIQVTFNPETRALTGTDLGEAKIGNAVGLMAKIGSAREGLPVG